MKYAEQTKSQIGQPHKPNVVLPLMRATGAALASLYASAEDASQFLSSHVLGISVETKGQKDGTQLKIETVEECADAIRSCDSG